MIPNDLKYTNDHEWVRVEGEVGVIGITHFAQDQLGDIVYVELPAVGDALTAGERFGTVESVKTVSDLLAPISGEVIEINPILQEDNADFRPEVVNEEPFGEGWMVKVRVANAAELDNLLDAAAYKGITEEA